MQTDFAVYMLELIDDKKSNNIDNSIIDIFLLIFVLLMSPIVLTFIYINVSSIKVYQYINNEDIYVIMGCRLYSKLARFKHYANLIQS